MRIRFIAVPYDSGFYKSGMGLGPDRLLSTSVMDDLRKIGHEVSVRILSYPAERRRPEVQSAFALASMLSEYLSTELEDDVFPIILSGNCCSSIGTVAGLRRRGPGSDDLGLLWFDAHGDYNTPETSGSGYFDGMALAVITGACWRPSAQKVPVMRYR